jgi:hypothetical protein
MWFRLLLGTLFARSSRTRSRKSHLAASFCRRSRSFHPLLDVLEDRTLLSTYTVTGLTDTGTGSGLTGDLRYCIARATSGNDTITFAQGLTGTIKPESALPALNASVAIQGPGTAALTVENDPLETASFDIFAVASTATVEISGLNISAIDSPFVNVGDIANAGTLTVRDDNLSGSITNSGTATVSGSTWTSVQVDRSYNSGPRSAGPIDNTGTMTISGSILYGPGSFIGTAAIANSGVLTLNYSTIEGISAFAPSGNDAHGGAIFNQGALTINNSTLTNNDVQGGMGTFTGEPGWYARHGMGGGIYMSAGTLSINSSTLSDNRALGGDGTTSYGAHGGHAGSGYGGGLYIAGGTVSINNSTFADNQAIEGTNTNSLGYPGAGYGGGIYNAAGSSALQMYDTILADNSAGTADPDLNGSVTSLGHNLIGNSAGGTGFAASDLLNVDPQLGPLQNNGGTTETMALLPGSPAVDAGDNTNAPAYDQRGPGFPRIVGGTIDIGAFEVQSGSATQSISLTVASFPSSIVAGTWANVTVTVHYADGSTDTGYTGTVHFTSSDGQAGFPADYTFTAADAGVHTFTATLKTAGTQSITASDASAGVSASEGGIVVSPAAAKTLTVSGFPSPVTAGQAGTFTVTAVDAYGNTATGYTGTVHFTSSDARAGLPANYSFQASDGGVHTFSATLKTAGTQLITATDTVTASVTGSEAGIAVHPAAASKFIITAPSSVKAGVAFSLTLTALDAYGNVVTGYTDTVQFSSTDATAILPKNYTFTAADKGVHTFTGLVLRKKGNQKITITDTHNSLLTGSVVVDVL